MSGSTKIPGVPFDPRTTGPLDLLAAKWAALRSWADDHSRELLVAGAIVLAAQVVVYAVEGVWVLAPPRLPNWVLVMIGVAIFFAPIALTTGVLLGRGLYDDDSILVVELRAVTGDERIRHVSPAKFEAAEIVNQNGERRERDYLQKITVNGREAYEVDCYDDEGDRIVASSMAGRTNREVRIDRHAIGRIKTDMEREVDEAIEFKVNFRDIVRRRAATVANWVIRTAQDASIPNGGDLYDEMQDALDDVDPYGDLHSPGDAARGVPDDEQGDATNGDGGDGVAEPSLNGDGDIFERAVVLDRHRNGGSDGE